MTQEFLSRDEVDALMESVGDDGAATASAEGGAGRLRAVNLATQEHASRVRMPALDLVHERFAELLRSALHGELRRVPAITAVPLRALPYATFIGELATPVHVTVVDMKPLGGHALVTIDASLVGVFVDALFGGGSVKPGAGSRSFTATEERLVDRIVVMLLSSYAKSWHDVAIITPERLRTETQPRFVQLADADDIVYCARFSIDIGTGGGALQICLPRTLLTPLRERLQAPAREDMRPRNDNWRAPLTDSVQDVEVELTVNFAQCSLRLSDLLNMQAGDLFSIDIPERVVAEVNGVPMFDCRYGVAGGHYALSIARVLTPRTQRTTPTAP
ncbi:MAG: flagellar motor switch protein FliM [Casimicrobiaceae bacterium]